MVKFFKFFIEEISQHSSDDSSPDFERLKKKKEKINNLSNIHTQVIKITYLKRFFLIFLKFKILEISRKRINFSFNSVQKFRVKNF